MNGNRFPLRLGTFFTLATLLAFGAMMLLGFVVDFLAPGRPVVPVIPHVMLFLLFCTPVLALLGFLLALFYLFRYRRWQYGVAAMVCVLVLGFLVCTVP